VVRTVIRDPGAEKTCVKSFRRDQARMALEREDGWQAQQKADRYEHRRHKHSCHMLPPRMNQAGPGIYGRVRGRSCVSNRAPHQHLFYKNVPIWSMIGHPATTCIERGLVIEENDRPFKVGSARVCCTASRSEVPPTGRRRLSAEDQIKDCDGCRRPVEECNKMTAPCALGWIPA